MHSSYSLSTEEVNFTKCTILLPYKLSEFFIDRKKGEQRFPKEIYRYWLSKYEEKAENRDYQRDNETLSKMAVTAWKL